MHEMRKTFLKHQGNFARNGAAMLLYMQEGQLLTKQCPIDGLQVLGKHRMSARNTCKHV